VFGFDEDEAVDLRLRLTYSGSVDRNMGRIELEDGSGYLRLEDGTGYILLES
jgi:hypothetical protein